MKPLVRVDFPPEKFPFTIEALHPKTRAVVWSVTVNEPEGVVAVRIPQLAMIFGHPVAMRLRFADGETREEGPPVVN